MTHSKFRSLVLAGAITGIAITGMNAPARSQQAPEPAKAPTSAAAPPADKAPAGPSADTLKKARAGGLKPEVRNGVTVFCWEDADIGTRFKTKKCVNEDQLAQILEIRQAQRDQMNRSSCTGACGGSSK